MCVCVCVCERLGEVVDHGKAKSKLGFSEQEIKRLVSVETELRAQIQRYVRAFDSTNSN